MKDALRASFLYFIHQHKGKDFMGDAVPMNYICNRN